MSHHTKEQIHRAFNEAPNILYKLVHAGVAYPRFELHADGSGRLCLGETCTGEQMRLAQELLHSRRPYSMFSDEYVGVTFCCGLVTEAQRTNKTEFDQRLDRVLDLARKLLAEVGGVEHTLQLEAAYDDIDWLECRPREDTHGS